MATPLQCSCLENPRDGGAWWAAVYGVAQSWTRLKQLSSSSSRLESRMHFLFCSIFICEFCKMIKHFISQIIKWDHSCQEMGKPFLSYRLFPRLSSSIYVSEICFALVVYVYPTPLVAVSYAFPGFSFFQTYFRALEAHEFLAPPFPFTL